MRKVTAALMSHVLAGPVMTIVGSFDLAGPRSRGWAYAQLFLRTFGVVEGDRCAKESF